MYATIKICAYLTCILVYPLFSLKIYLPCNMKSKSGHLFGHLLLLVAFCLLVFIFSACDNPAPEPQAPSLANTKWISTHPIIAPFYMDIFGRRYDPESGEEYPVVDTVIADFKQDNTYHLKISYLRESDTAQKYYDLAGTFEVGRDPNVEGTYLIRMSQTYPVPIVQDGIYQLKSGNGVDSLLFEVIQTSNNPANKPATPGKGFGSTSNGEFQQKLVQRFFKYNQ